MEKALIASCQPDQLFGLQSAHDELEFDIGKSHERA
jgi:hypothetical protein